MECFFIFLDKKEEEFLSFITSSALGKFSQPSLFYLRPRNFRENYDMILTSKGF